MRRKKEVLTDVDSPDFAVCEHCGEPIGWDDISYTHMSNGFATCGTIVGGGTKIRSFLGAPMPAGAVLDPEIIEDPDFAGKRAEPTSWYEDVAA